MKLHLSLATDDLPKSVAFYSVLLDATPVKLQPDYALFITEQPPLELALDAVSHPIAATRDHYGIYVETAGAVDAAIQRLEKAGLAAAIEREETCCYARQSKVWAIDPAGRRWEIYTVHEETPERDGAGSTCCAGT